MAIKINFTVGGVPEYPTLVLAKRDGTKLGLINNTEIHLRDCMNQPNEMEIKVFKELDGVKCAVWDELTNFKLIWCKEWNLWFDISVDVNEKNPGNIVKNVSCVGLGAAELSQLMLYDIEINTEKDIAREDYDEKNPTVLYRPDRTESSLLHRIMSDKAPHYEVMDVDPTIANIQRTFAFNDKSIYDAFQEIAEEIGCLFITNCESGENGKPLRHIYVRDLQTNCNACGHRGEFTGTCPKCGSEDLKPGYGKDTTIFITSDVLGNEIEFNTDVDSVKNCFKLEGGDDLMTATVKNLNPNGSSYIWHVSEDSRKDMSKELRDKLAAYDSLYEYYQDDHEMTVSPDLLSDYNKLVDKYAAMYANKASNDGKDDEDKDKLEKIATPIKGYPALMEALYDTIDFSLYLESGLMPTYKMQDTTAAKEAAKLTSANLSPVAISDTKYISETVTKNAALSMAKVLVDPRYKVEAASSSVSGKTWTGSFKITNMSAENDTATSSTISVPITDDLETYLKRQIDKALNKSDSEDMSVSGLFKKELPDFKDEIKKYCLNSLSEFWIACQSCIAVLDEEGVGDTESWNKEDIRQKVEKPYREKMTAIEAEIQLRERELGVISGVEINNDTAKVGSAYVDYRNKKYGVKDVNTGRSEGLKDELEDIRDDIQGNLNFEGTLKDDGLWNEFCAYRREDCYQNDFYTSEGLSNAELFDKAREFLETASRDIYKASELQHTISTSLRNLLVIKKFEPIREYFEVGNWIRIQVDDKIYKLRLLEYQVHYDDLSNIDVTFSDVMKIRDGLTDFQSIMGAARAMASSYSSTKRQSIKGNEGKLMLDGWVRKGLDATNARIMNCADNQDMIFDEHGMLFRKYDPLIDEYSPEQMKIVNSTLAITKDNWEHAATAVGRFYYHDPLNNGKLTQAYGVNAEVLIGQLILGEQLGIINGDSSLSFDRNGLRIENDTNIVTINPNDEKLFRIQRKVLNGEPKDIFYANNDGDLEVIGKIIGGYLDINNDGTRVTIDPEGRLGGNGKIFDISKGNTSIMSVDRDGNGTFRGTIYADDGKFSGEIDAQRGKIGGFTIDSHRIYSFDENLPDDGVYITPLGITLGQHNNLILNSSGKIYCFKNDDDDGLQQLTLDSGCLRSESTHGTTIIKQGTITTQEGAESMQIVGSTFFCNTGATFNKPVSIHKTLYIDNNFSNIRALRFNDNNNLIIGDLQTDWDMDIHGYCKGDVRFKKGTGDEKDDLLFGTVTNDGKQTFRSPLVYHTTTTSNSDLVMVTDYGILKRVKSSSSHRYKENISTSLSDDLSPEKLYDVDIVEYKYKHSYLDETDERFNKKLIGFIAEDIEKKYPIAANHNEDGSVESWNEKYMIPAMLKLIQDQHEEIQSLKNEVNTLKNKLEEVFEFVTERQ